MRKTAVLFMAVCGALLGAGCEAELGACDDDAARTLVYDEEGNPSFAGQALINGTCAGAFCHSSEAKNGVDPTDPNKRNGVPGGFDFDLPIVGGETDDVAVRTSLDRARAHQALIADNAASIWEAIESGDMPRKAPTVDPFAKFHEPIFAFDRAAAAEERVEVPGLDTPQGRELARNWLACGAPIIDRLDTTVVPAGVVPAGQSAGRDPLRRCTSDLDCDLDEKCYVDLGECASKPDWPNLFASVIVSRCAVEGCHGGIPPGRMEPTGMLLLDPDDSDVSYDDLVAVASMGAVCIDAPRTRVIANDAMDSLLIKKLEGDGSPDGAECGDRMPQGGPYLSPATIAAFREWIDTGALRTPPPP